MIQFHSHRAAATAGVLACAWGLASCGSPIAPGGDSTPQVFSISPSRGPVAGGTTVRISGANFAAGATVTIGGIAARDVVVESAAAIAATTGQHPAGISDVVVSVAGRSGSLASAFTYEAPGQPPVLTAITARGTRQNEPADFADLGEEIDVTASVQDPDTPVDQLVFAWIAESGAFTGSGASVKWRAPAQAATPSQVKLTVTVSDGSGNRAGGEKTLQLHDSVKEVGDLARQFLRDFSDSSIRSPELVVRNFSTSTRCKGERDSELDDVVKNRRYYRIESSSVGAPHVTFQFGGRPCNISRSKDGDACAAVPVVWQSLCLETFSECVIGERPRVEGTDYVGAVFEQSQWRLCSSDFRDANGIYRPFFIR